MKRVLFVTIIFLSIVLQNFALDEKGYIGISLGPSIPIGDLSSKDPDNEAAGWANTGALLDISFAYLLGEGNFGIAALLRGQANPTDVQALVDEFHEQYPTVDWTVESTAWGIGGLMFGGFGSFPISDKATFDAKAMIGFLGAISPEIKVTGTGPGGTAWVKTSSMTTTSFAYLVGIGFKFDIGDELYLLTDMNYLGSKPEYVNVETTSSLGDSEKSTWSQEMGTVNFSAGIALKI